MSNEIAPVNIGLRPQNYKELRRLSDLIFKSSMCPKGVKDPDELFLRMHFGLDVGLSPLAAAANVMVVNGKPSLYGDGMLGIVQANPKYEWHKIEEIGTKDQDNWGFKCTVKRKNMDPVSVIFTKKDAVVANLWGKKDQFGKPGPWCLYPQRMLKAKAIGFALRDVFADVLQGMISAEEAMDHPTGPTDKHVAEEMMLDVTPPIESHPVNEVVTKDGEVKTESVEEMLQITYPIDEDDMEDIR